MLTRRNLIRGIRQPSLMLAWIRRFLLFGGVLRDPECMHLVYAWSSGKLQRREIRELFPGIEACVSVSIRKPESRIVGWSLDLQELVHMLSILRFTGATRILEIGTFDGFTTLNLAANMSEDGQVATVDLPQDGKSGLTEVVANACDGAIVGSKFVAAPEAKHIRQFWADSTAMDWSSFGCRFDLILIDGCHDYRFVKSDSANAVTHVRPGGTVLWHDYGQAPDVSRAIDELARDYPIVGMRGTRFACFRSPEADCRIITLSV